MSDSYDPNSSFGSRTSYDPNSVYSKPQSGGNDPNSAYNTRQSGGNDPNSVYSKPQNGGYDPNSVYNTPQNGGYDPNSAYRQPQTSGYDRQSTAGAYRNASPNLEKQPAQDFGAAYGTAESVQTAQPKDPAQAKKERISGCLFIFAFLSCMIGMVVASQIDGIYCVSVFGAMIVLFGIGAFVSPNSKYPEEKVCTSVTIAGGAMICAMPLILRAMKNSAGMTEDRYASYRGAVMGGVFFLIGLLIIILTPLTSSMKKKRCTMSVEAVCVELLSKNSTTHSRGRHQHHRHHHTTKVYAPVWEFPFDGSLVRHAESTYTNVSVPQVGERQTILVNPNDENDIFRSTGRTKAFIILMGLAFAALGLSVMLLSLGVFGK